MEQFRIPQLEEDRIAGSKRPPDTGIELLSQFLETLIYCVLCHREIYPAYAFEKRKKFGEIVYRSKFVPLSNYILEFVENARKWILQGTAKRIEICISDYQFPEPLERIVIELKLFPKCSQILDENLQKELESALGKFFLTVMLSEANYPSRACRFSLQVLKRGEANDNLWMEQEYIHMTKYQILEYAQMDSPIFSLKLYSQQNLHKKG